MKREQFEHAIRAAGAVLGVADLLVIGSQAIRLIRFETPATNGVVAWCLEPHDLWISNAIAGRHKDIEFCTALLSLGIVTRAELVKRLEQVSGLDERVRALVRARIA